MLPTTVRIRYIVTDVDAAIAFYTDMLGFHVNMHPGPGFAMLSRGNVQLLLNRPGAGGAEQAMPDGQVPASGGWNRIQLKGAGCRFRNEIVTGNGGQQVLIEDPAGNLIELSSPPAEDWLRCQRISNRTTAARTCPAGLTRPKKRDLSMG